MACNDQSGAPLAVGDQVLIVATVVTITEGDPCIVAVTFTEEGELMRQEFNSDELIKAQVTISGNVPDPTQT